MTAVVGGVTTLGAGVVGSGVPDGTPAGEEGLFDVPELTTAEPPIDDELLGATAEVPPAPPFVEPTAPLDAAGEPDGETGAMTVPCSPVSTTAAVAVARTAFGVASCPTFAAVS